MRKTFVFAFLLAASFAFGQKVHELKTDVVLPFVQFVHLGYEFVPQGRLGIEANLWYHWAEQGDHYIPPPIMFYEAEGTFIPTQQQVLTSTIAAKYYFSKQRNGSGLYLGGYVREDVLVSRRNERYAYLYLNNYGYPMQNHQNNRQLRSALGLLAGYKYIIGQHVLLEAGLGLDLGLFKEQDTRLAGIPMIRAGYRF